MTNALRLGAAPSFSLHGKRALVTGAGRGIGLAAAAALASAGAQVLLAARTEAEISAAASAIRQRGDAADHVQMDVLNTAAVRDIVQHQGPFDILVNNAGTNVPKPVMDVSEEDFDSVMALNVRATYFVAQAVARRLIDANKAGSIINISSQMGHVGAVRRSIYCASKHAVEGFTKAMAIEFGPHAIRVNTVCPTFVETPMTRPFLEDPGFRDSVLRNIKLGRVGQVEDVTGAIVFLASDASSLITGSAMMVDGGWTAE
jgi:NAD(P)-dependent dehydrogenase (short-subunit alcohol dehydrogenase family)